VREANEEDLALCARSAAGDERAFALLVAKHERALRSFLARLGSPDIADDIAQEAFIKAWRFAGRYDGRARFSTWLTKIAWRCWLDRCRKRDPAPEQGQPAFEAPSERPDIDDMLARLTHAERAALILCEGHGWTHAEAAAMLDMPPGTLKSTVARAKAKCRTMWEGEGQ
jgi:RNA polymerase sigma factor (sigma-70 family)